MARTLRPHAVWSSSIAWLLGIACSAPLAHSSESRHSTAPAIPSTARAPQTSAPPKPTTGGAAAATVEPSTTAASDAGTPDRPVSESKTPAPVVEFEPPYKPWHRPRANGGVYAAGQDEELARWNVGGNGDPNYVSSRAGYHPGTRVRVDVDVLSGRVPKHTPRDRKTGKPVRAVSEDSLLARLRKYGYWPFRLCFEEGLRRDRKISGETIVRASVDARGRLRHARLVQSKLRDREAVACLVDRVSELQVDGSGRRINLQISIQLWPGDAPVPNIGPPQGQTPSAGEVDLRAMDTALDRVRPPIRDCYAQGLEKDPALWGRIELRIELDAHGSVRQAFEQESRFPDPDVTRCVRHTFADLTLPAPSAGAASFVFAARLGRPPALLAPPTEDPTTSNRAK